MKLDRIEVTGYRRLCSTSAYVGRKTVAIVGPNEAGKSSLLHLLVSFNHTNAIPESERSRELDASQIEDSQNVSTASFLLSSEQQALVADFPLATAPRHYVVNKTFGGATTYQYLPQPTVKPQLLADLKTSWPVLRKFALEELDQDDADRAEEALEETEASEFPDWRLDFDAIDTFLASQNVTVTSEVWRSVSETLTSRKPIQAAKNLTLAVGRLARYVTWLHDERSLNSKIQDRIKAKRPSFVLFEDRFRRLKDEYDLDSQEDFADPVLENLLRVGGAQPVDFVEVREDSSRRHTLQTRVNARLRKFFVTAWNQAELTVEVSLEGPVLHILVADLSEDLGPDHLTSVRITDRSDGLRMFVCLAAFLASRDDESPPILLIDEAEQHLHLNAQADLVRLLQSASQVSQVIYTTHSPGCLPSDLGTGVRFIEPDPSGSERSSIRHDFWSMQGPQSNGFSPLLLVMGAGSAAFASLRFAVVAEGASDMLLLPLMIRVATGEDELPCQVAPGISMASKDSMRQLELSAAKVVYVVDGDDGGREWRKQLISAGVGPERIHKWVRVPALEDLFAADYYLAAINLWLDGSGLQIHRSELVAGPIKSAVETWHANHKVVMPGSIAMAEFLLGRHESGESPIKLSARGASALREFHGWASTALEVPLPE